MLAQRTLGRVRVSRLERRKELEVPVEGALKFIGGVHLNGAMVEVELRVSLDQLDKSWIPAPTNDGRVELLVLFPSKVRTCALHVVGRCLKDSCHCLELFVTRSKRAESRRVALERRARLVDSQQLLARVLVHRPAAFAPPYQSVGREAPERVTHGGAAHPESFAQFHFDETFVRTKHPRDHLDAESPVRHLGQRRTLLSLLVF